MGVSIAIVVAIILGSGLRSVVGILTKPKRERFDKVKLWSSLISATVEALIAGAVLLGSNTAFDESGLVIVLIGALKFGWNGGKDGATAVVGAR